MTEKQSTSTPVERSSTKPLILCLNISEDSGYLSTPVSNIADSSSTYFQNRLINDTNRSSLSNTSSKEKPVDWLNRSNLRTPSRINFYGRDHVDFIYHLGERRHYTTPVTKILSYLKADDLHRCVMVSKSWRNVIMNCTSAEKRLCHYVNKVRASKENKTLGSDDSFEFITSTSGLNVSSLRPRLSQIQNIQANRRNRYSSSSSPPVSPTKHRFRAFQKEGEKLGLGERLLLCPRCSMPSHVKRDPANLAVCSNNICKYKFCAICQCEEHHSKPCDLISTPVARKRFSTICSKKSKKNLQRLLL